MRLILCMLTAIFVGLVVLATALEPVPKSSEGRHQASKDTASVRRPPQTPAPAASAFDPATALPPAPAAGTPPAAVLDPVVRDATAALRALGDFVSVVRGAPGAEADFEIVVVPRRIQVVFREGEGRTWLGGDVSPQAFAGLQDRLSRLDLWTLPVEAGGGGATSITAQAGEKFWTNRPAREVVVARGPGGTASDFQRLNFGAILDAIEAFAAEHATEPIPPEEFERAAAPVRRAGGAVTSNPSPTGG